MDAGVVASVKVQCRSFEMERAVTLIDESDQANYVYKRIVLAAMSNRKDFGRIAMSYYHRLLDIYQVLSYF